MVSNSFLATILLLSCIEFVEDCEELNSKVKEIRNVLDQIQLDLYSHFRPELRQLKGIVILDDYSLSQTLQIRPGN